MDTLQQVAQKVGAAAKFDYSGFKYGVDTSHHNGVIDWKRVKDEGIINADGTRTKVDFAYVKITEGASGRDPKAGIKPLLLFRKCSKLVLLMLRPLRVIWPDMVSL